MDVADIDQYSSIGMLDEWCTMDMRLILHCMRKNARVQKDTPASAPPACLPLRVGSAPKLG